MGYVLVVGVLLAFLNWLVLILAAPVAFFITLVWLTDRYPGRGLFGGRRRC
jgi:hypothetical protein